MLHEIIKRLAGSDVISRHILSLSFLPRSYFQDGRILLQDAECDPLHVVTQLSV